MLCDLLLYSSTAAKGIFESHLRSWTVVSVMYVFLGAADLSLNYSGLMWIKLPDNLSFCSGFVLLVLQGWEGRREPCLASTGSPDKISVRVWVRVRVWFGLRVRVKVWVRVRARISIRVWVRVSSDLLNVKRCEKTSFINTSQHSHSDTRSTLNFSYSASFVYFNYISLTTSCLFCLPSSPALF